MENASGDLRRALGGPILGRQMLELTRLPWKNLQKLTHTTFTSAQLLPFAMLRDSQTREGSLLASCLRLLTKSAQNPRQMAGVLLLTRLSGLAISS